MALIRLSGQRSSGISIFVGSPLASEVLSPTNFAWSHKLRVVLKGLPQGYIAWRRNTFDTLLRKWVPYLAH